MSEISRIVEELEKIHFGDAWHGLSLKESISGLTDEQAIARPLANAHSIFDLVWHIAVWENVWRRRLEGEAVSEPEEGDFPTVNSPTGVDWMKSQAKLKKENDYLIGTIEKLTDANLEDLVAGQSYTVRFLLRGIIRHAVYHTGQIASLRKAFTEDK
jgi:uncharacterized damage-inducible protein DinB